MSCMFKLRFACVFAAVTSLSSLSADFGKAGHERPDDDNYVAKRQKVYHDAPELDARPVDEKLVPQPISTNAARFLAHQNKVRHFQKFRLSMERKFSYWGDAIGAILDKFADLYLDRESDKPGVFVIGSTPGVGKNTLAKHFRDFLEHDPFAHRDEKNGRFHIIKDKSKRVFDTDILKNTGSSELTRGIHKVVVIDEIQTMLKDSGLNIAANELWFQAFGDAEINLDIGQFIEIKKTNILRAQRTYFSKITELKVVESDFATVQGKLDESKTQESPQITATLTPQIATLEKKKEELQAAIGTLTTQLTVDLRELMSEVPDFFTSDERAQSATPELLAQSFLALDSATIERRFKKMPTYKHLYFNRNIYIFLGNPTKTNDDIRDEISRSDVQTRDSLRAIAKEKLTEDTVRAWFISHALHGNHYASNKDGWNSRIRNIFAICPPASKHIASLIRASIESDFCTSCEGHIEVREQAITHFAEAFANPNKDLRSLSSCYAPLTRMFDQFMLKLPPEHDASFLLDKQENQLVLMLQSDNSINVTHQLKTPKPKKETLVIPSESSTENIADQRKQATYSAYYYAFYHTLFTTLPANLYRIDDERYEEFYTESTRHFNLATELSMLTLNLVLKYVGMTEFCGQIETHAFKKDRVLDSLTAIIRYIKVLKKDHSAQEVYDVVHAALRQMHPDFARFFFQCGMFAYLDQTLVSPQVAMAVDLNAPVDEPLADITEEQMAETIFDAIINFSPPGERINDIIRRMSQSGTFSRISHGLFQEFLGAKKLTVTFDSSGQPSTVSRAGTQS